MGALRHDIIFTGRVQGVGFRFTACRLAERFRVGGWVRNEPDGSVRCVIEGEPAELDRFLAALNDEMAGRIADIRIDRAPVTGEFSGFAVRR
jgi:acylphosphatase